MSEPRHGFTCDAAAVADELVAARTPRPSESFQQSHYEGLKSKPKRPKYAKCDYLGWARELMPHEVEELQRHVDWLNGNAVLPAPRRRRSVV